LGALYLPSGVRVADNRFQRRSRDEETQMPFADSFVQCMAQYSVTVDPSSLYDADTVTQALNYLQSWYSSLDQDSQAVVDAGTTNDPTSVLFADDVAPAIPGILQGFDAAVGQPFSYLLQVAVHCAAQAAQQGT
jgi:hypothetical protein